MLDQVKSVAVEEWLDGIKRAKGTRAKIRNLMKRHIRPVAKANGIHKNIGWHAFRHTFGTLLKANGEDVKTVQQLLRHANSRITPDTYTQAVSSTKRAARSKVIKMMAPGVGRTEVETDPQIVQRGA